MERHYGCMRNLVEISVQDQQSLCEYGVNKWSVQETPSCSKRNMYRPRHCGDGRGSILVHDSRASVFRRERQHLLRRSFDRNREQTIFSPYPETLLDPQFLSLRIRGKNYLVILPAFPKPWRRMEHVCSAPSRVPPRQRLSPATLAPCSASSFQR